MQLSFNHIQATIKALREKVISRMSLARKIDEFSNNTLSYNGPQIVELPNKVCSELVYGFTLHNVCICTVHCAR